MDALQGLWCPSTTFGESHLRASIQRKFAVEYDQLKLLEAVTADAEAMESIRNT